MSYYPVGDFKSTLSKGLKATVGVTGVAGADLALRAIEDPYLPEMICQFNRLSQIENLRPDPGPCKPTVVSPSQMGRGVGMRHMVPAAKLLVTQAKYPWLLPVVGIGTVLAIYSLGFSEGMRKR